jgi:hypothetical protein
MQIRKRQTCKTLKDLLSDRLFGRIQSIQNHETLLFLSGSSNIVLNIRRLLNIHSDIEEQDSLQAQVQSITIIDLDYNS